MAGRGLQGEERARAKVEGEGNTGLNGGNRELSSLVETRGVVGSRGGAETG